MNEADNIQFSNANARGLSARYEAQRIAFGPVVFQCIRIAWKSGLLALLAESGREGATVESLTERHSLSTYAISVLLESALSAGVVNRKEGRYTLTRIGDQFLYDTMTQVNLDYINDVCYRGLERLESSLVSGRPDGLTALGEWPTIYEGLSSLPEPARQSWFAFDHLYSDSAFGQALPLIFVETPSNILDFGANTGKWAIECLRYEPEVELYLADLPIQLAAARANIEQQGLLDRVHLIEIDFLQARESHLPEPVDAVWMSQFLTCFGLESVAEILRLAERTLKDGGSVWILDTFWDRQQYEIASYCLINTSPYFTAMASGNSKMYESSTIIELAARAGLKLAGAHDGLGISHSLLQFTRQ